MPNNNNSGGLLASIQVGPFAFLRTDAAIPAQRETFAGMAVAVAVTAIAIGGIVTGVIEPEKSTTFLPFLRGPSDPGDGYDDDHLRFVSHLRYAFRFHLALVSPLVVLIMRSASYRFFHTAVINGAAAAAVAPATGGSADDNKKTKDDDRDHDHDEQTMKEYQSILQNTLEQTVVAVLVHSAWAAAMPTRVQTVIPVASCLFVVGRVGFVVGYSRGAGPRSVGMALTMYPSVFMLLLMVLNNLFSVIVVAMAVVE